MKKVLVVLVALLCLVGISNAQSKFGVSAQGVLSLPMGDFGNGFKTGFGATGTVTYMATKELDVVATFGYLTYTSKASSDATFSTMPILGGIRYYFANKDFKPYLTAQAGIFSSKAKVKIFGFEVESTSSDFGFVGGAGFLYKLGNKLNLDVTATFNSISSSGSSTTFVNVMAGVHFAF